MAKFGVCDFYPSVTYSPSNTLFMYSLKVNKTMMREVLLEYLEASSLEGRKCTTLRLGSSGCAFYRNFQGTTREYHPEADKNL